MVTIIHGADSASSRKYFLDLKEEKVSALLVDGKNTNLTDLVQIFEGGELFNDPKSIFVEELIGKRKSKEFDQLISYLGNRAKDNEIYLWENNEVSKTTLNQFKNYTQKVFKLPQNLFLFLDNIKPGNGKELIKLLHQTIETSEIEMVFFMIVRHIRILLCVIESSDDPIEEVKKMAPWQKSKFQHQADFFEVGMLKTLYKRLFEIEKNLKTGNLSTDLVQTIDFLLTTI